MYGLPSPMRVRRTLDHYLSAPLGGRDLTGDSDVITGGDGGNRRRRNGRRQRTECHEVHAPMAARMTTRSASAGSTTNLLECWGPLAPALHAHLKLMAQPRLCGGSRNSPIGDCAGEPSPAFPPSSRPSKPGSTTATRAQSHSSSTPQPTKSSRKSAEDENPATSQFNDAALAGSPPNVSPAKPLDAYKTSATSSPSRPAPTQHDHALPSLQPEQIGQLTVSDPAVR